MRSATIFPALIAALAVLCTCSPAAATSIQIAPTAIDPGDSINVSIRDLADGAAFLMVAEAVTDTPSGPETEFVMRTFSLPFTLLDGEIGAATENTARVEFSITRGGTTARVESNPDDGIFATTQSRNITAGLYDRIRLQAEPLTADLPVRSTITIAGRKSGPDDAELSFAVEGIEAGRLRVLILIDEVEVVNTGIAIGTPGEHAGAMRLASADGVVRLESRATTFAALVGAPAPPALPEGWEAVSDAYALLPRDLAVPAGTTLTFTLPDDAAPGHAALGIAHERDGTWELLPGTIAAGDEVMTVSAPVSSAGTFVVVDQGAGRGADQPPLATSVPGFAPPAALAGLIIGYLITWYRRH
jgi:hypothetical protein